MKQILIISILAAQFAWAQDSTSVQVIARSLSEKVMLRWAVDQPIAWKKANNYGFLVERATISRNGEAVVPIERQILTPYPLKPKPLEEWAALANQDQNVAVLAQALYGSSFETVTPNSGTLGRITAVNDELEQRFTFGLLAAEQSFQGALLAGWGLEDSTVVPGEKYLYKVSVALPPETELSIARGSVYAGPDLYEELPKPIGLAGVFGDSNVTLSWNYNLLSKTYTSYFVERSEDNSNFEAQNKTPIFNAAQNTDRPEVSLFYTDSIVNNRTYHYRVKGRTAFGETGPATEPIFGNAQKALGFVPRINQKELPTDNKVILFWEFKEQGNELIEKFRLHRSDKNDGPFEMVIDNIPADARKVSYNGLGRINYFKIVAVGKNGVDSESFPTIVQPVDSIPPGPPIGLTGVIDTMGIVRVSWTPNTEEDLKGYRIFRSNNPNVEYSEVTKETFLTETFTDTVPVKNLDKKIYYKLRAEDQRYNRSDFSDVLTISKPDVVPPSSPVLRNYKVTDEGIRLTWIPSNSADVRTHVIYRKNRDADDSLWQKRFESVMVRDTTFLDSQDLEPTRYSYTVVALDSAGLESASSTPINLAWSGKVLKEDDILFSGTVNRELRFINLSWKVKNQEVSEYRLYRGTNGSNLKLYKTFDGNAKGYNDTSLEINSEYDYGIQLVLNGGRFSVVKKIRLKY